MHLKYCLFVLFSVKLIFCVNPELINAKIVRKINLDGQFVKTDSVITIEHLGSITFSADEYIYIIDRNINEYYIKFRNVLNEELKLEKNNHQFTVFLDRNLLWNETFTLRVEVIHIGQIVPLHKTITFSEDQFLLYNGNLVYYSVYKTLVSESIYNCKEVEDLQVSEVPDHQLGNILTYRYENVDALTVKDVYMEYKNNNPLFVVTNLERIIDVSHFGQICLQDSVAIKNAGNKLVGPYTNNQSDFIKRASDWWYTHLPASVQTVEYFDTIGKISTSTLIPFKTFKTLKFKPRYPVLSGWKTFYIINYCVPAFEYLYHDLNGRYVLKIRVIDHILNDVVIKKALIKILLPEGAEIIKTDVPYGFERMENEKIFTGLSTFGRPTIVINGSNVLENHVAFVEIEYLFYIGYLFRVPLVLVVYLKSIFVFVIWIVHIKG